MSIEIKDDNKKYFINALYHKGIHHCIAAAFSMSYFFKININIVITAIESFKRVQELRMESNNKSKRIVN